MKNTQKMGALMVTLLATGCATVEHAEVATPFPFAADNGEVYIADRISHTLEFPFDSAELPFDAAEVIEPHARHLLQHPDVLVVLQGSASSEGSAQYNYELGLARANSVKSLFKELGVSGDQLIVTSIGETRTQSKPHRSVIIAY